MPLFRRSSHPRQDENAPTQDASASPAPPASSNEPAAPQVPAGTVHMPAHLQRMFAERSQEQVTGERSVAPDRRAVLERKRIGIQFDIDQGELAQQPDNPWAHRVELLTDALGQVEAEIRKNDEVQPGPWFPVLATPIASLTHGNDNGITLSFEIGGQPFRFEEETDWAERGTQIAEPVLRAVEMDVAPLLPPDLPEELHDAFITHMEGSVFAFATDCRNRIVDGDSLPEGATLADLAKPCPTCGGWTDWIGVCTNCSNRKGRALALFNERKHLLHERAGEIEERHRMIDRLPLARKQLADVERDLAALTE